MSFGSSAAGWALALALLASGSVPAVAGPKSIFDDEDWEEPAIEGSTKTPTAPPPPIAIEAPPARPEPKPEPEPEPVRPPVPPPTSPNTPNTPVDPVEVKKPVPPPVQADVAPRDMIKLVTERLKAAGPQPAKLGDDSIIMLYHQKAVAHAQLGELPAARDAMQKVMNAAKTNRSVVLNAARIDIAGRMDAMRAAVTVERYLKAAQDTDEDALQLWGYALATYARHRGSVPEEKVNAFVEAQTLLEQTRPGSKRWGNSWVTESEFKKIEKERDAAQREADSISRRLREKQDYYAAVERSARRRRQPGKAYRPDPAVTRQLNEISNEIGDIKKELYEARKKIPKPVWTIPLRMDDPDPMLVAR